MTDVSTTAQSVQQRVPWNKGKIVGAKPPLRPKHVWSIRTRLQGEGRIRDLALFNVAIDSKLRGCDVVRLKVDDVAPSGYAADRASVRQKKTGRPVKFALTESTRQAIDDYLRATGKKPGESLFTGRRGTGGSTEAMRFFAVACCATACGIAVTSVAAASKKSRRLIASPEAQDQAKFRLKLTYPRGSGDREERPISELGQRRHAGF